MEFSKCVKFLTSIALVISLLVSMTTIAYGTQTTPDSEHPQIGTPFLIVLMWEKPQVFSGIITILFVGTKVDVISYSGDYCLVETSGGIKGYVFTGWIMNKPKGKLSLNKSYETVYHNGTNLNPTTQQPRTQAVYSGYETVKYSTDNPTVISVDSKTGLITGKKPGKANFVAKAGDKEVSIPVCCVYRWDKSWTGKASKSTDVYSSSSADAKKVATLSLGESFIVSGDDGFSAGLAYGKISGTDTWGFIPISHISKKGTVSQYSGLGWVWPLQNFDYNYIYSPYAPRSSQNDNHRGIDINEKANQSDIEGQPIVAAFDGIVKDVGHHKNAGYYVCLLSNDKDFITGEKLVAIYMHMNRLPAVSIGFEVEKGKTLLGYVGNTGNSRGSHLHFEVNNINAGVDDSTRHNYTYTINPIYFYVEKDLYLNYTCSAYQDGFGFYWYG